MTLFIAGFLLTGCNENSLEISRPRDEPGIPSIAVVPPSLQWGQLTTTESEVQTFTVRNIGDTPVIVNDITIEGVQSYTVLSSLGFVVERDEEWEVEVEFSPINANNDALLVVWSDDPDEPASQVQLTGLGSVPELTITPEPFDFGDLSIPCSDEVTLTLQNTGEEPLSITSIDYLSGGDLVLVDPNSLPVTLSVGDSTDVTVVWTANVPGPTSGELVVGSNDPRGELSAVQSGTATFIGLGSDALVLEENPPVDILFAVDQSCSMDADSSLLGQNFSAFIDAIGVVTDDWQIGVANVEDGCFNSGILTPTTPNYQEVFATAVVEGSDPGGTLTLSEKLLQLTELSLSQTGPGQCNAGFLRPGAVLHVIVVSDEPNRSSQPWTFYQNAYANRLADPDLLSVSAVIDSSNCALGGEGYPEIVGATGGVVLDLCGPWASQIDQLGQVSVADVGTIQLSQVPDPDSLEVEISGSSVSSGWAYDETTNSVSFNPALGEGTSVVIDYSILATCD